MSFLEEMKRTALKAALNAFDGYPLEVSEAQLNRLAATLTAEGDTTVNLTCLPGAITLAGETRAAGLPLTYSTRFALEACEISPTRKVLTLRRLDAIDLGGNSLATALYARIVKTLICGLFGIDPARLALRGVAGVTVEKDLITADLDAMGATDIILEAIKEKLPPAVVPLLEEFGVIFAPGLGKAGNALLSRIGIDDIAIGEGGITGKLRIHAVGKY